MFPAKLDDFFHLKNGKIKIVLRIVVSHFEKKNEKIVVNIYVIA